MLNERDSFWARVDPASDDFRVEDWPFYHMARLVGLYHLRLDAVLKPIGMDVPRWRVLSILVLHGDATITKLSDEAVTRVSTMAKIIQRMVAQGLVVTQVSAQDARATEVAITDQGRSVLDQVRLKVGGIFVRAFHGLSESELRQINGVTARIHANLL